MKNKIALALLLGASSCAFAGEFGAISPKLSTLGLGVEYKHPITENIAVSAGLYGANYSRNDTTNKVKYDAKLKLRHFSLLGNYYPWDNGFHFAGGLVFNGTKVEADAEATQTAGLAGKKFTFNGRDYTVGADIGSSVSAKADFRKVAPYLGIGWDNGNKSGAGFSVAASAGVMFSGKPKLTYNYDCKNAALCSQLEQDIQKEKDDLQKDLNKLKIYPVLSLGIMYNF